MILYIGTAKSFIQDVNLNKSNGERIIVEKLREQFIYKFRREPSDGEVRSWNNSLKKTADIFEEIGLKEQGVILEYQLPLSSKRIDCIVVGKNKEKLSEATIIELKQWSTCSKSKLDDAVITMLDGKNTLVSHPSVQVKNYIEYIKNATDIFNINKDNAILLSGCVFLHNYKVTVDDALLDIKFENVTKNYPTFTHDKMNGLKEYLINKVSYGVDKKDIEKILSLNFETNRSLNDSIVEVISGNSNYVLLDEQKIAFDTIKKAISSNKSSKKVLIVNGGPGTGKSVIALNILAYALRKNYKANYATGSKWFTKNLRAILKNNNMPDDIYFKYFNQYDRLKKDSLDLLICDEAHRIRGDIDVRTKMLQIEQIINAAKVTVFFIDDNQHIRPNEIGSSKYIEDNALRYSTKVKERVLVWKTKLTSQFRCGGMDGFVSWIDNTLDIDKTANILWTSDKEEFEFKIFNSPEDMERSLFEKAADGYKVRMTAGFCWPWSENGDENGNLVDDVVIGTYKRAWNPSDKANYKVKQNHNIPSAEIWPTDPRGMHQVGCVYTVQGFEYDYVGVIFGEDLVYHNGWKVNKNKSFDTLIKKSSDEEFMKSLKNIYRVLLSRGVKGCYVYFMDKKTEEFIKSRLN